MRVGHKLDDAQKIFVVQRLACFDGPRRVASLVKEAFGVAITPQAVECYDPGTRAGRSLAQRWRKLFEETRAAYLADTAAAGVAHKRVRLDRLDRMAERAENMGALKLAAELLEQAAKEMGGAYERRGSAAAGEGDDGGGAGGVTVNVTIRQFGDDDGA